MDRGGGIYIYIYECIMNIMNKLQFYFLFMAQ